MSAELIDVTMPDGTVISDVPKGTTQSEVIKRYGNLLASRQAASKQQFDANAPSLIKGFGSEVGQRLKQLWNLPPETGADGQPVQTGMDRPETALLGLAVPSTAIAGAMPSTARAGGKFEQVMSAAKDVPINTGTPQEVVARAQELRQRGSSMPKVLNDFIKNRNGAEAAALPEGSAAAPFVPQPAAPMTYQVGRDFATNAGALSARETMAANPPMQRQIAQFAKAMKDANREAATSVGMGDLYDSAMREYRQAKTLEAAGEVLKKYGTKAAILAGLGGAGAAAYRAYQAVTK